MVGPRGREGLPSLPGGAWPVLVMLNGGNGGLEKEHDGVKCTEPTGKPWRLNGPISGQADAVSSTNRTRNTHREVGDREQK